jgi:hypothetical protein
VKSLKEGDREVRNKDGKIRREGRMGEKGELDEKCAQSTWQEIN